MGSNEGERGNRCAKFSFTYFHKLEEASVDALALSRGQIRLSEVGNAFLPAELSASVPSQIQQRKDIYWER